MAPFPSITFTLLDMQEEMRVAWEKAFGRLSDDVVLRRFTFVTGRLEDLKDHYDCMVSPANSYGIMDGGCVLQKSISALQMTFPCQI